VQLYFIAPVTNGVFISLYKNRLLLFIHLLLANDPWEWKQ